MRPETTYGYRSQLKRGETLDLDQQRTLVDEMIKIQTSHAGGKPIQQAEQAIRERENNIKQALVDIGNAVDEAVVFGGVRRMQALYLIRDYVSAARKMLVTRKTKDMTSWADWKVMVDEDHK